MLKLSVKKGDKVYFNHSPVVIEDVTKDGVTFKVGDAICATHEGDTFSLNEFIKITIEQKSSARNARIAIDAPNTVAVNKDSEYEAHTKRTHGLIVPPRIVTWMRDWFGTPKDIALNCIGAVNKDTFEGTIACERFEMTVVNAVVTKATVK